MVEISYCKSVLSISDNHPLLFEMDLQGIFKMYSASHVRLCSVTQQALSLSSEPQSIANSRCIRFGAFYSIRELYNPET